MVVQILTTKFFPPPPPPKIVARTRLIDRLNEGLSLRRKLTLISAPAGFGKSTLVSAWLSSSPRPSAWLSLDENDRDPVHFWIYFISALQMVAPNLGAEVIAALQSPQAPPIESILTVLINAITALPTGIILVLDDYHLLDAKPVDAALSFFIDHLPPQLHLVITTREDPVLPLSRLRARGQLTELRAADLRFTPAEAAEFLDQVMGLHLSADQLSKLEARTEGWIAGLQLAALSMQSSSDVSAFIRAFAGDHRYIVDYLVDEVLQHQPEPVRSFLLQTSILERLNGSLCDAVTNQSGSSQRLAALQRGNLFLIPLDDQREWYRYHHLFAGVLQMHLRAELPAHLPALHLRASAWFEQHASPADAIHHALAAGDFERAARLMESAMPAMRQSRQESTLLTWFQALPAEFFQTRPLLSVHYAGILLQNGRLDGVEPYLLSAERWLNQPVSESQQPVFTAEADFQNLPALIAMYRAGIALMHGDVANTLIFARQVLVLAHASDDFLHGAGSALLGLAYWTAAELETAYNTYAQGMAHLHKVGFISDVIGGSVTLADLRITQGRLRAAQSLYERGLQLAASQGEPPLRGTADMLVGLSDLCRERNELALAVQYLNQNHALGELNGLPKNPYRWRLVMARIHIIRAEFDAALHLLAEAERLYTGDFSPNVRPVSAYRARLWLAQGKLDSALSWAREQSLSAGDDLSYLREFEHITLARILLAQHQRSPDVHLLHQALGLLERLAAAARHGERTGSLIEILVLQALACQANHDFPAALDLLTQALTLAAPEGYVRIFLDEGQPLTHLLLIVSERGILPDYCRKLLAGFEAETPSLPANPPSLNPSPAQPLIEPLSPRELELLRLFTTELSGPEIADELVVALSTVRTHTKGIYSKLSVNSRRAAVSRAIELGLI